MLARQIPEIQSALAAAGLDGWFFACFQQNDPLGMSLLGLTGEGKLVSRRCYYLIPREGEPKKLVHAIEPQMLDHLPGE
jgi:Xaa-Pro dipeptidase